MKGVFAMIKRFDTRLQAALWDMVSHILENDNYIEDVIFLPERAQWYYDLEKLRGEIASIADSDFFDVVLDLQSIFYICKEKVKNADIAEEKKEELIFEISKRESEFAFTERFLKLKKAYED